MAAQFFSALADNALLIIAIAMLRDSGPLESRNPLKLCFTLSLRRARRRRRLRRFDAQVARDADQQLNDPRSAAA